jgi:hypothetical protein
VIDPRWPTPTTPFVIARTDAVSPIHRPARMTSIAVRVRTRRGEYRFVGLLGSAAYRQSVFAIPVVGAEPRSGRRPRRRGSRATRAGGAQRHRDAAARRGVRSSVPTTSPRSSSRSSACRSAASSGCSTSPSRWDRGPRCSTYVPRPGSPPRCPTSSPTRGGVLRRRGARFSRRCRHEFARTDLDDGPRRPARRPDASSIAIDLASTTWASERATRSSRCWARSRAIGSGRGRGPSRPTTRPGSVPKLPSATSSTSPRCCRTGRDPHAVHLVRSTRCRRRVALPGVPPGPSGNDRRTRPDPRTPRPLAARRAPVAVRRRPMHGAPRRHRRALGDATITDDQHVELQRAFVGLMIGEIEPTGSTAWCCRAGLDRRQIAVIRLYTRYLRQAGSRSAPTTSSRPWCAIPRSPAARRLFDTRFDPAPRPRRRRSRRGIVAAGAAAEHLDAVPSLDDDRICRAFLTLIDATDRTNAFSGGARSRSSCGRTTSGSCPSPSRVRDLRVFAVRRGGAPPAVADRPRWTALERPAGGLPHRGARPGQGADGQERRDRARWAPRAGSSSSVDGDPPTATPCEPRASIGISGSCGACSI